MKTVVSTALIALALATGSLPATAGNSHRDHHYDHYDNRGLNLPPGLARQGARGEPLPPGWQRRLNMNRGDYLPEELYRYGRSYDIDDRRERVEIEGRAYYILRGTREIIDILDH